MSDTGPDASELASAALARILRLNGPGKLSLAGAYALGYGGLGMAQHEDDGPDWFHELDPLDTLFLGTAWPNQFRDSYEFGNARTAWLRLMRTTPHWRGIERFVNEVMHASEDHDLPIDDGDLMLLVAGRLEDAGLDQRKLPAGLLPGKALAHARFLRGPAPGFVLPTPPADATDRITTFWAGTEVDLPHDGTAADALREGLHLLRRTSLDLRAEAPVLLPALYLALAAKDEEPLQEAGERAHAWALGVAEDSPFAAVLDVILTAVEHGLDVDTTLGHLYGLPAFTEPVPAADQMFTSAPGGALTQLAFDLGFTQVQTRNGKVMRLAPGDVDRIRAAKEAFEDKFGRPPGPNDPLFFDPGADTPQPVSVTQLENVTVAMLEAAGVSEAWIYACRHTGGLLPRPDGTFATDADARDWHEAINHYLTAHPGQSNDPDADLARLRIMLAISTIHSAADTPTFGAALVRRLTIGAEPDDNEVALVREFLTRNTPMILELLREPGVTDAAAELARTWSGASLAEQVRVAARADSVDPRADVLLAAAAAARATMAG
ncbi:hypothetical protein ABNF97_33645 [Plantactinospora sp. B6F1]|uniref:hypothetical protein n=1 Tax=Plantactinospora sp. B6F1 TaxID=3158971 RepID=UPI0032D8CFBB